MGSHRLSSMVSSRMSRKMIVLLCLSFLDWSSLLFASANGSNYHIYNYDQTSQQFTPDGRLIQVEYASKAVEFSSPVVVVECLGDDEESNNSNSPYPCLILVTIPKQANAPQQRMVILNDDPDDQSSSLPSYVVVLSGVLSDSLALLQAALKQQADHQRTYHKSFRIDQMANILGEECHGRVWKGGIRPYGSTLVLCGYEDTYPDGKNNAGTMEDEGITSFPQSYRSLIYQTDPSGAVRQYSTGPTVDNINSNKASLSSRLGKKKKAAVQSHVRCIVGGSSALQRQLEKRLQQGLSKLEKQESTTLAQRIATIAQILNTETNKEPGKAPGGASAEDCTTTLPLEVVVISPNLGGCRRLDQNQLDGIRALALGNKRIG
ncbi:proteasome endopeptidase complex subunit alpha [Nitzschia inconspicua]|uniref:Proteasome endopeptidase complex subunit alpha n=1 Tax=Nitzschia inconspicua TaxID=303405 RepID=A0A9K3KTZ0_9STRA|nr:proteasome endopeptidase complex subunit alpha [Nitzschia inconspicua]